jgi:hypothetical protein
MSELPTSSVSSSHYCSRISSTNMEFCSESISFIGMKEKKCTEKEIVSNYCIPQSNLA